MPPKKEKKEVKPVFDERNGDSWWQYRQWDQESQQKVDQFLNEYTNELKEQLDLQSFENSFQLICRLMGIHSHPILKPKQLDATTEQVEKPNWISLQNTKLDYATIKIVLFLFQQFGELNVFKFCNNQFGQLETETLFKYICDKDNKKVIKLFFDWNPINKKVAENVYQQIGLSNLEIVILRSNQIDCQIVKSICQGIVSNPNCNIKHLELYDNRIQQEGFNSLGELLDKYQKIEYLGLAKNQINSFKILSSVTKNIGVQVLSETELADYRLKEKEREEFLADAKKKKKKINENELPVIPPLTEISEGKFGYVRNKQLKVLNLAENPFNDKDLENVKQFIDNMEESFQVILVHSGFEIKTKEALRLKYQQKVLI